MGIQVVAGCGHLKDARACLKQAGLPRLAPELIGEIEDALHDLQAPALLVQLKVSPEPKTRISLFCCF